MGWGRAEAYGVALMWATELLRSSLTWSDEEEDGDDSRRPGGKVRDLVSFSRTNYLRLLLSSCRGAFCVEGLYSNYCEPLLCSIGIVG